MCYLVTGGLGVGGSLLTRQLCSQGHTVVILDAMESPRTALTREWLLRDCGTAVTVVVGRVESYPLDPLVESCDAIIHAAAHTGIPHSALDPEDDWVSNVDATRKLLDAVRRYPRPTVVMSSVKPYRVHDLPVEVSGDRYIWRDFRFGISESWPLEPDEPYAASKLAQSALTMAWSRTWDLPVTCLRFSNLYGPALCHGPRHGWLTWFCLSAAMGVPIKVQGNGFQVRDMLYSSDINAALLTALDHIQTLKGQVFNVGGGTKNAVSVNEAAAMMGGEVLRGIPGRQNEDPIFITDHDKFSSLTGWKPLVSVTAGVDHIAKWSREHVLELREVYAQWL